MAIRTRQSQRRRQVLTPERIVEAAVELLDTAGTDALTVRALTGRLATGSGAIYWHIGNMKELLVITTDAVVSKALADRRTRSAAGRTPQDEIRSVALGLFDAVTEHPWLAAQLTIQLTRNPWGPVTLQIFESIGRPVRELAVARDDWFATSSTLVHYILGATAQTSTPAPTSPPSPEADRAEFLTSTSRAWQELDPDDYPFIRDIADQMRDHDDREQFLSGIDLILAGITVPR